MFQSSAAAIRNFWRGKSSIATIIRAVKVGEIVINVAAAGVKLLFFFASTAVEASREILQEIKVIPLRQRRNYNIIT